MVSSLPTLAHTRRLQQRVRELENAMSASQQSEPSASKPHASQPTAAGAPVKARSVDSSIPTDSPSPPASSVLSRQFEGLKLEDDGRISFHGPTSFFSIPNNTGNQPHHPENQSADDGDQLRHNALRQRTFEQLANLPVYCFFWSAWFATVNIALGAFPVST